MELLKSVPELFAKPQTGTVLGLVGILVGAAVVFASPIAGAIVIASAIGAMVILLIAAYWVGREQRWLAEVLRSETTLEVEDDTGSVATLTKNYQLKFLQHRVFAINEPLTGSGNQLAAYSSSLGAMVDRFKFGDGDQVVICLREFYDRGNTVALTTVRKIEDAFTSQEEFLSVYTGRHTGPMLVKILLPGSRPVQDASYVKESERRSRRLQVTADAAGRQTIQLEVKRPSQADTYTLNWRW